MKFPFYDISLFFNPSLILYIYDNFYYLKSVIFRNFANNGEEFGPQQFSFPYGFRI